MNFKGKVFIVMSLFVILSMVFGSALAEDGQLFRRNVSKTPEFETEKAGLFMMDFYVPAQSAAGLVGAVDNYILADGTTEGYEARDYAKPLITVYIDGPGEIFYYSEDAYPVAVNGGIIFGAMDAFVGVSLDDGTSWKTTNVSRSADLSSFTLANGEIYPGHVHNVVHQVFNDNILVAYASKYCEGGTPLYSLDPAVEAEYFGDLETTYGKDAVYLYDLFGVAGTQDSVDYTAQGFPEVGEVPYSCIWTVRGKLLAGDDPATTETEASYVMWAKPERLTSGKRDANLPVVDCAKNGGCMVTWQEDPEGLRPGLGLGPGEGWSGAVANQQTDIWYTYISFADFDKVFAAEDTIGGITMADYAVSDATTMPKSYVPMAMPIRLTDNAMCKAVNSDPYCYIDFDAIDSYNHTNVQTLLDLTGPQAGADFCATQLSWLNPGGTTLNLCVTEDDRLLNGRVAATRVRMNLKPYTPDAVDDDGDGVVENSAWIVMAAEETKALGTPDQTIDPVDIGKDVFYYSFDPFQDQFMVGQGGMINQPAVCSEHDLEQGLTCTVGEFFPLAVDERGNEFYLTEIARRFALTTNSVADSVASESGLSAMLIFKQGIINQGGPADILLRRVIVPEEFDRAVDNPYAFENMACNEWAFDDGSNPNYLQGLCLDAAINITGNTIVECTDGAGNDDCAALFPVNDDGSISDNEADFTKVTEWRQCDGLAAIEGCEGDSDLDDQTWENPFDVAKGHRGFLDGDFVMMMYAWAPNWKSNSVGNDHYNLYVRRSFDGGLTWTTTPAELGGTGVTVTENYYGDTIGQVVPTEWTYGAGDFEQGRNVSLLTGNKITILDPRYSPTGGMKLYPSISTAWMTAHGIAFEGLPYADDAARARDKFFMIYETGDNTTVDVGEAVPLDLYYSRATIWGDVWEVMDYTTDTDDLLLNRWPWAENKEEDLSGEAAMVANPGGTFMYATWNQWKMEIYLDEYGVEHEHLFDADMPFRRFMYLPDDATTTFSDPVADILSSPGSALASDLLTFIGTGLDADNPDGEDGIVSYDWYSNINGYLGSGQILNKAAGELSIGRHVITLVVTDDEGVTSSTQDILVIAGSAFRTDLPFIRR